MRICKQLLLSKASVLLLFIISITPVVTYSQGIAASAAINTLATDSTTLKTKTDSAVITPQKIQKPNPIDAQINYTAQDSIVFLGNGTVFLHNGSNIKYKNIALKADFVRIKMDSSMIFAKGTVDSLGAVKGEPVFNEGQAEYSSKALTYNLRTKKGYIRQAVTQQGEGYVISDKTKKTSDDEFCISGGKYTTCDNHDHPDFYLSLSKGKVNPGNYIVAGPAHLVIADVPLPIAIPFGFFPFTDKYSSGILMPSYADELTRGLGLTNGGYYFALNDFIDMEIRGDIYTKGTWGVNALSTYTKRYKYRGTINASYREDVTGEIDLPDYSKAKNLSIRWSHSQDQKANPYRTISASVNFSTSGYNRSNINSYYRPELNSENTKSSSVSFSQRFPESPFSISGSMLLNQRTKDSTISLTLPNISISMSRIYPLKRKNPVGKERWYEKISMSYSGTFDNNIDTKENKLLSSSFVRDWKNGMRHSIPVSATFNILKYINISPAVNYTERWYLQSVDKSWDNTNQKEKTDTINGFNRVFDFNLGVSASTKLYGFYIPIRSIFGDKIDRIRHVLTPSIGYSFMPDFGDPMWGYYSSYTKTTPNTADPALQMEEQVQYSRYEMGMYGTPGRGKTGSINFSLGNNVEMKVRNDKDTTDTQPFIKVSLIDNLSISGGYNMAADSLKWSTFSSNIRLKFGKSYSLSLSGAFDPYMYGLNSAGNPVRINKLRWNNGGFPRFLGTSTSASYTLNNDTFKKLFNKDKAKTNNTDDKSKNAEDDSENLDNEKPTEKKTELTEDGYEKLAIPWSIGISYSIRYANNSTFDKTKMEYDMDFVHNLSFTGSLSLSKNWNFNSSTSYDFDAKQFSYTSINITRNLHCWSMSGSIVPFGVYKSYTFKIGVNSSMLQDLKYDKQSDYGGTSITWY